jgi:hypothetical protein
MVGFRMDGGSAFMTIEACWWGEAGCWRVVGSGTAILGLETVSPLDTGIVGFCIEGSFGATRESFCQERDTG